MLHRSLVVDSLVSLRLIGCENFHLLPPQAIVVESRFKRKKVSKNGCPPSKPHLCEKINTCTAQSECHASLVIKSFFSFGMMYTFLLEGTHLVVGFPLRLTFIPTLLCIFYSCISINSHTLVPTIANFVWLEKFEFSWFCIHMFHGCEIRFSTQIL